MTLAAHEEVVEPEIVPSKMEAVASIERAIEHAEGFWKEILWQVQNRVWEPLNYDSFDELWEHRYSALGVRINREERPELVVALRSVGQKQQAIADKLGVTNATVSRDLSKFTNVNVLPETITDSRGREMPTSYNTRPRDEWPVEPDGEKEKEMPATMEHRSPFAAGEAIRDFGNGTTITVSESGLAESTAESVAMALDWYRGNPTGETAECESATGVSERVAERSRAALIDNKEIPDPKPNHLVANFDSIAQGLTYVADDLDSMTTDLERATAEDLEFGREYFEDAMKKLNAFRKLLNAKY